MYKISIIIPMYNAKKYLRICLDSIVKQTLNDIEVITINDRSFDNTLQIVQEYKNKVPNLSIISTKNYGPGHARNIGIELAEGEYIKFLDADDELPSKNTLEKIYNIASTKEIDILIGKYYTHLGKIDLSKGYKTLGRETSGFIKDKFYPFKEMPGVGDKLFRKEHIGTIRFPETKWEDLAFTPTLMAVQLNYIF